MSSKPELWLMRHGETEWSLSGAHTSYTDLQLTAEGAKRAQKLAEMLQGRRFCLILSSPMKRALDTAKLAGLAPEVTDDLKEWNYGSYEGLTTPEIQKSAPNWTIWTGNPPGGEIASEVAARADRVIARALEASCDVALFGHGHMLRVLTARWLGLGPEAGRFFALSTGTISVLGWERETRVIKIWNQS